MNNEIDNYLNSMTDERQVILNKLRLICKDNLPVDIQESFGYNMINYVIPLSIYPKGYHVKDNRPLPFMAIAFQKKHLAIYHFGIYMDQKLMDWFISEYHKYTGRKLDMGKSCLRFKNINDIPYDLIKELCKKMSVDDFIRLYEASRNNKVVK